MLPSLSRPLAYSFIGRLIQALLMVWVYAIVTRLLPNSETGLFILILSISWLLSLIYQGGINQSLVTELSASPGQQGPKIASALSTIVVVWALVFLFAMLVFFRSPWAALLPYLALLSLFMAGNQLLTDALKGIKRIELASSLGSTISHGLLAVALTVILLVDRSAEFAYVLKLAVAAQLFAFLVTLWPLKHYVRIALPKAFSPIAFAIQISAFALLHLDLWMVALFYGLAPLAVYGVSAQLASFLALPSIFVNSAVTPAIAEMRSSGFNKDLSRLLRQNAALAFSSTLPAALILLIFPELILRLLFGELFDTGADIVRILTVAYLVRTYLGSPGYVLLRTGNTIPVLKATAFCVLLICALSYCSGEPNGVAWAASIGIALHSALLWAFVRSKLQLWTHADPRLLLRSFS